MSSYIMMVYFMVLCFVPYACHCSLDLGQMGVDWCGLDQQSKPPSFAAWGMQHMQRTVHQLRCLHSGLQQALEAERSKSKNSATSTVANASTAELKASQAAVQVHPH